MTDSCLNIYITRVAAIKNLDFGRQGFCLLLTFFFAFFGTRYLLNYIPALTFDDGSMEPSELSLAKDALFMSV